MKNIRYFLRVFDTANQLLTRHSPCAPLGQVDEWTAKPSPFSIHGPLSESVRIMATKIRKNSYRLHTVTFKTEENQITKRKTDNYVFSGFGDGVSRGWERKSTNKRFNGEDQFNNWKLGPWFIFVVTQHMSVSLSAPTHFLIRVSILSFSSSDKVDFSCQ